jgi:hypothetical protein
MVSCGASKIEPLQTVNPPNGQYMGSKMTGQSGDGEREKARGSFLKKEPKNICSPSGGGGTGCATIKKSKFFGFLLSESRFFYLFCSPD